MVNKIYYPEGLPIVNLKEIIIDKVKENKVLIIAGETGSGKSTQLPKMCLEAGFGKKKDDCLYSAEKNSRFFGFKKGG